MNKKKYNNKKYAKTEDNQQPQPQNINKKNKVFHQKKKETPIKKIDYPQYVCTKCGQPIEDISSAISDKETGNPIHFTCVIEFLKNAETLKEKEEIIYIGNGNFAIVYFENPKIRKKFKIVKLIEWEDKNKNYSWKTDIAELASRI